VTPAFDLATLGLLVGGGVATVVVVFAVTLGVARAAGRHSVVDVAWGPGFVAVAAVTFVVTGVLGVGDAVVSTTVLALVAVWGLRLAIYIGRCNHGKGEDPRYAEMLGDDHPPGDRERFGAVTGTARPAMMAWCPRRPPTRSSATCCARGTSPTVPTRSRWGSSTSRVPPA
jgi:hypothetical protein